MSLILLENGLDATSTRVERAKNSCETQYLFGQTHNTTGTEPIFGQNDFGKKMQVENLNFVPVEHSLNALMVHVERLANAKKTAQGERD